MEIPETVKQWLDYLDQQGKSAHTIAAYRRGLAHYIRWNRDTYNSDFDPSAVIPRDVRDWKAYQQTVEKAAPSTINQRLVALSRFFDWGVEQEIARTNPTASVHTLDLPRRKPKALSQKDQRCFLRAVHQRENLRDIAIVEMLVGTGLRVAELLALQVGDVEINGRSGWVKVRKGKRSNQRNVPLKAEVRSALMAYLAGHPHAGDPNAHLWIGQQGPLKDRSAVLRMLNKYAFAAKIDNFGPHVLRHTFSDNYLRGNPDDLRGLAALLGHTNLNTVMIYTEPSFDDLAERVERG
ncbi:MAG: tyrosine-type recombinase/integrase [Chloroflexota bacterium]